MKSMSRWMVLVETSSSARHLAAIRVAVVLEPRVQAHHPLQRRARVGRRGAASLGSGTSHLGWASMARSASRTKRRNEGTPADVRPRAQKSAPAEEKPIGRTTRVRPGMAECVRSSREADPRVVRTAAPEREPWKRTMTRCVDRPGAGTMAPGRAGVSPAPAGILPASIILEAVGRVGCYSRRAKTPSAAGGTPALPGAICTSGGGPPESQYLAAAH